MSRFSHIGSVALAAALTGCAVQAPAPAQPTLSPAGQAMFNGRDFSGWELVTVPATPLAASFQMLPDGVIASTGKPIGYLASAGTYANFRMHVEWRWAATPGNGGVLLHITGGPKDRAWPLSLQVQTKAGSAGDLLPMAGATFAEPLTSAPGASVPLKAHLAPSSEKPAGEWNSCDIVSRAGTLEVTINGVLQNRISGANPGAGRVGFQLEGTPYELRNVTLAPLP